MLWERVSDVQVPRGILWVILISLLIRQRRSDRVLKEFEENSSELGTLLGVRMREGDERDELLLDLQGSIERLTRWLVGLTVLLGIISIAGMATTIWAVLK